MLDAKIETFLQVAQLGSFTAAAAVLHLTQPAVTQHIRKLEAHYGCTLVDCSHRAVKLTEAGARLCEYLLLQRANEQRFAKLLHNTVEPLCIGATLSIADYYLPDLLVERLLLPGGRVRVTVGNTARLLAALRAGELDGAFIEGLFDTALLSSRVLYEARLVPVVAAGHPLLGRQVTLEELHAYPLALREPHSGTRDVLENWLMQQNDAPQAFAQTVELGSFVLIKKLVQRSTAVTFVYEAVVREELRRGELCLLSLRDFCVAHALRFVYRRGDAQSALLERFFEELLS